MVVTEGSQPLSKGSIPLRSTVAIAQVVEQRIVIPQVDGVRVPLATLKIIWVRRQTASRCTVHALLVGSTPIVLVIFCDTDSKILIEQLTFNQ